MAKEHHHQSSGWASTPGGRDVLRVSTGIVLGTALGLGATSLFAQPANVTMYPAFGGSGHMSLCSSMYSRSTVYIGGAQNTEDEPVSIVSVTPTGSTAGLHVEGFAFQPDPTSPSNGASSLPALEHPHTVRAHEAGSVSVLLTGPDGSLAGGFDVTIQHGGTLDTHHLDFGFSFDRSACPAK